MSDTQQPSKYWVWGIVLLVLVVTAGLRIRLLEVPLERDEGGYAYTAQLILQGTPPFVGAYDIKMPGLYYVYALILLIFGQTIVGIHLGLLVFNAATIVMIFLLGKRLFDSTAGVAAAAGYAAMSLSQAVLGFSTNAEHLLLLPALGGILLLLKTIEKPNLRNFFLSGLLLGLALVTKHQGIFFVGFAGLYLLFSYLNKPPNLWKRYATQCAMFALGVIVPFALLCGLFYQYGLFDKFWFWLFEYTRAYSSVAPFHVGLILFEDSALMILKVMLILWVLAGAGFIFLFSRKSNRQHSLFIIGFAVFSFLSICPGLYFRPHYFVLLLPVAALLIGITVSSTAALLSNHKSQTVKTAVAFLLIGSAIAYTIYTERLYLFKSPPKVISQKLFGRNPFPESIEIAKFIKQRTSENDSIAILGSEPQICFYSGRRSASAHIYIYPLMALHKYAREMNEEMISEIESAQPKFLVYVKIRTSWLAKPESEEMIFKWAKDYIKNHYRIVGVIDLLESGQTIYRWGDSAADYSAKPDFWIHVYQRK